MSAIIVDTDESWFQQLLERQRQDLEKAKRRQGELSHSRFPKEVAYKSFMKMLTAKDPQASDPSMVGTIYFPPAYLLSVASLAQLQPTTINQLRLELHHRGTYLMLRVMTPPKRTDASILVLVEDVNDNWTALRLHQREQESVCRATEIVDVGAILIVKEPFYQLMSSDDYVVSVDHLSDVVRLNMNDAMIPQKWAPKGAEKQNSAEAYKRKGDAAVKQGAYHKAIREYSNAIAAGAAPDRIEVIRRNRFLAYLKTKQYDAALADINWPNFGPQPAEKALYRAAEALYSLARFSESARTLQTLHAKFPGNPQATTLMERALKRCVEHQMGRYDFKLMQDEAQTLRPTQLDHATYVGPIGVQHTATKGRGMFVTKSVKAGDLLLCVKAFAYAYESEADLRTKPQTMWVNVEAERAYMGNQVELIRTIAQKLFLNLSFAQPFTSLYHGNYEAATTSLVDDKPIVDTFLIERIIAFNVFGCPFSSLDRHNVAAAGNNEEKKDYHSVGIWAYGSLFNHSCTCTAYRSFIGDMFVVRAAKDLEPGDEVTIWYQTPHAGKDGKSFQEELDGWSFKCTCPICEEVSAITTDVRTKRAKVHAEMQRKAASGSHATRAEIERLVKEFDATYTRSADQIPRLGSWEAQMLVAYKYMEEHKAEKALEAAFKMFQLMGFTFQGPLRDFKIKTWGIVFHHHVDVFLLARDALLKVGTLEVAMRAEEYARTVYRMVVGEDDTLLAEQAGRKN